MRRVRAGKRVGLIPDIREKPAGSAIQFPLDMPLLEQLSQKRCVAWKCVIASKAVLAQIIPASDTSSRALQHQMSRVVVLFALLRRRKGGFSQPIVSLRVPIYS